MKPLRKWKPYPSYKASGVEWLGEIPAHWEVRRLKHLATLNPESLTEQTDPEYEMTYVDIGSVDTLGSIARQEELTFASAPSRARRLVRDGDVIISTVRTYLRAIAPISNPKPGMVVSTGFAVVRPVDTLTTDFAAYALRAPHFVERVVANSAGVSFPAIKESQMATYELAIPPEPEQRAIAAFLDRETGRIDTLVKKKERLIALLQERRTALITRAVTKGLDPAVPMKDSGVEWLGEIPEQWEVHRLKFILDAPLKYGANESAELDDPDLPRYVRITDIDESDGLRHETFKSLPADVAEEYLLREGDLLFARSGATAGKTFLYRRSWGVCAYAGYLIRARLDLSRAYPEFVRYFTASSSYWQWLSATFIQATIQNVSADKYANLLVPQPSLEEQRTIAAFLDRETARIDALIAKVRDAIERLRELRLALISAAVTGRIDVREEAA